MSKILFLKYSELAQILKQRDKNFRWDSLFSSESWVCILEKSYSFNVKAAISIDDYKYIIYAEINNSFGKKLVSLPFSDYMVYHPQDKLIYEQILEKLEEQYTDYMIHIKTNLESTDIGWGKNVKIAYYHQIVINDGKELKSSQSSSFRRGVKKAEKSGVIVELSRNRKALIRFYKMNSEYRISRFNKVPQPFSFFKNIYDEIISTGNGFILEAKLGSEVLASVVVLEYGETLYYKFGCSSENSLLLRPNNLIFSYLIEYALNSDIKIIDLGLSGSGKEYEGLRRFKESMGANAKSITYFEKNSSLYPKENSKEMQYLIKNISEQTLTNKNGPEQLKKMSSIVYPFFS